MKAPVPPAFKEWDQQEPHEKQVIKMSIDKSLSPLKAVSFEEYHKMILGLVKEDLRAYVTKAMTKAVHDDPLRQDYPVRTTVNELASQAAHLLRTAESKSMTGWLLPGCDIPDIRGGGTNIKGWRPNMIVTNIDGKDLDQPEVIGLSNWGEHVVLWKDKDLARKDQQRVAIPLYRPVTIIVGTREFNSKDYGKQTGWDLLYLKEVHSTKPLDAKSLVSLLLTSTSVVPIEELSEKNVFTTVVLKDVLWNHTESIDQWGESPDKFDQEKILGPDGQQLFAPHPLTGAPTPQVKMVPKRTKLDAGQPFIQDVIGSKPEEGLQTATLKIMLAHADENFKLNQRVRVEFQNYRYGRPEIFMPGLKAVTINAANLGNFMDSDPTKNPYAAFNNAYRGLKIVVVANVSKVKPYTSPGDATSRTYVTLIGGLVFYEKLINMDPADITIPDMPEKFPMELVANVEPVMAIDPAKGVAAAKPVVVSPPVRGAQAAPQVIEEEEEEDDEDVTREDELYELSPTELKKMLRKFRKEGHEVVLRGNKAVFVAQILQLEKLVTPQASMEAHEEAVKVEAKEKVEKKEDPRAEAKSKLIAKKRTQVEATSEVDEAMSGPAPEELKELEEIIRDMIADVPGEVITWDDLGGDNNDMGIFPTWVTASHKKLVETMIERIQKEQSG